MNYSDNQTHKESKLHWLFLPDAERPKTRYDTILAETANFAVVPTKGSIVPGWVLVVPKFPIPRMADVPAALREELNGLIETIFDRLERHYGTVHSFEHGGFRGSSVSCGVDQAHLHIAPLSFDLIAAAKEASEGHWTEVDYCLAPAHSLTDREYWFVSSMGKTAFKPVATPIPQFFRRIIAKFEHKPEAWDYRANQFQANVELTIDAMGCNG